MTGTAGPLSGVPGSPGSPAQPRANAEAEEAAGTPNATEAADAARFQQLVADVDTGARRLHGAAATLVSTIALLWSLWQLFYASPIPFALGAGILNDTEARALHRGLGLSRASFCYRPPRRSPRGRVPPADWLLAAAAAFCGAYLLIFYRELATRPGQPTTFDIWSASLGIVLLLEATRRSVGWPMTVLAAVFLGYVFAGPLMPDVLAHKGASLSRALSQMWLTTEGVFGVALGVSSSTIFIYVLFGALLDRAGGGNYMMQVSFALLGHLRGGPAKVSVVSSALNGMISGSSVANVVSGGIFTIPLMKRAGYGGVKAGAIETMSSVDGQIMPPVMGAAAFLMTEYVGIPYSEIVKHAFLPAILSYISLFYIVHLEAIKLGMMPMVAARARPLAQRAASLALGASGSIVLIGLVYYAIAAVRGVFGDAAAPAVAALVALLYVAALWQAATAPELPQDIDIRNPVKPDTWPTVRAGLHFLIPVGVLVWLLMVDEASPSLSAFWACTTLIVLMLTQHPLIALMRRLHGGAAGAAPADASGAVAASGAAGAAASAAPAAPVERAATNYAQPWRRGLDDTVTGLTDGARNMVGIAVATGTAGIIVGTITLTGLGLRMTDFVEFVSAGNVTLMLLFTAFVCLVLGLGVPTTANYILVASLMAPVIVELGAQNGIVIPLIAVHLFVFYYGIMGDITPPVGLATFAAAAISGEDAIATGIQGSLYALRTVVLPFIWIFNPQLLLIDVDHAGEAVLVIGASLLASLMFAAATMNWFRVRSRWWETALLLVAVWLLFRPNWVMDQFSEPWRSVPASELNQIVGKLPDEGRLVMVIQGQTIEGDESRKTLALQLGPPAEPAKRLADAGLTLSRLGDRLSVIGVKFGSRAKKAGFEQGWEITEIRLPSDRPDVHWVYLPALLLIALVAWLQGRRLPRGPAG